VESLIHGDRLDHLDLHVRVVARHDHLLAVGQLDRARYVGRAEVELRPIAVEERRVASALVLREDVHLGVEVRVRRDRARLGEHLSALDLLAVRATAARGGAVAPSRVVPRRSAPALSPACAVSRVLLNISTPVTPVFAVSGWMPTISTSSPTLTSPCSTPPVVEVTRRCS